MNFLLTVKQTLGNHFSDYLSALLIFIGGLLILSVIRRFCKKNLKKETSSPKLPKALIQFIQHHLIPLGYLGLLSLIVNTVPLNAQVQSIAATAFALVATIVIIRAALSSIELWFDTFFLKKDFTIEKRRGLKPLLSLIKLTIWIIAAIFLLGNLGVDVTAALAGLGIGGIAVAIAAQGLLSDLFSYFVVYLDKPFEIGDFIVFGDSSGVVENIGIKSSRIRALSGEIMVLSNSSLTSSVIHNYKQMEKRRVAFSIDVPFETPSAKLQIIPSLIKNAIQEVKTIQGVSLYYSHLSSLANHAISFETVYYVPSPDYAVHMQVQQEIFLAIVNQFGQEEIAFAYPTSKLFFADDKAVHLVMQDRQI
ncbi:MAG: mechanosensitive ion channel family protein [Sphaerochaetaceae bacterium]